MHKHTKNNRRTNIWKLTRDNKYYILITVTKVIPPCKVSHKFIYNHNHNQTNNNNSSTNNNNSSTNNNNLINNKGDNKYYINNTHLLNRSSSSDRQINFNSGPRYQVKHLWHQLHKQLCLTK